MKIKQMTNWIELLTLAITTILIESDNSKQRTKKVRIETNSKWGKKCKKEQQTANGVHLLGSWWRHCCSHQKLETRNVHKYLNLNNWQEREGERKREWVLVFFFYVWYFIIFVGRRENRLQWINEWSNTNTYFHVGRISHKYLWNSLRVRYLPDIPVNAKAMNNETI